MDAISRVRRACAGFGIDAALLTSDVSRFYVCGVRRMEGMLLVAPERCYYFTDFRYIETLRERAGNDFEVGMISRGDGYVNKIKSALEKEGIKTLGVEEQRLSHAEYRSFERELGVGLADFSDALARLRSVKTEDELRLMEQAQRATERALDAVIPFIRAGVTEKSVYAELQKLLYTEADEPSFDPIVVSGAKSSLPHGVAGDKVIERGDFVTLDLGAKVGGYCADMTRTFAVGFATDEMREIYSLVLEAQAIGLREARAGIPWKQVDSAARDFLTEKGHGEHFGHGLGHGVGLEIHELTAPAGEPSPVNSIATVEPGIYIPGRFGVRIEDMVILKSGGNVDLTRAPNELKIL